LESPGQQQEPAESQPQQEGGTLPGKADVDAGRHMLAEGKETEGYALLQQVGSWKAGGT